MRAASGRNRSSKWESGCVGFHADFYKTFGSRMRTLPQGADTIVWLAAEDPAELQEGAFYLDRKPAAKHLPLAGTTYSSADVERLWSKLAAMVDAPMPS